jgi:hypothetical protein
MTPSNLLPQLFRRETPWINGYGSFLVHDLGEGDAIAAKGKSFWISG